MLNDKSETLKTIIRDILIFYLVSFVLVLATKTAFAFINGDEILEVSMLTFRSYLLGTVTTEEKVFSMVVDNIGIFAVHFTLFFSLLLYYFILTSDMSEVTKVVVSLVSLVIGIVSIIFMRERFIFCIPFALALCGILYILTRVLDGKLNIDSKFIVIFNRIFVVLVSVVGIALVVKPYIFE